MNSDQDRVLRDHDLVFLSKGPVAGMWRCQYLKCPLCGSYVLKGANYDRCTCGKITIDSDMLRVVVQQSSESDVESYKELPRIE